ncbi:MAG: helix-turn-helix domain-containing protein [Bacteroidales bacterium]|jgi:transcriptional regulator with XRE-family HTH domain|nr:helix-turn-helix domain-containing protein [Bacteroidales bacterium]
MKTGQIIRELRIKQGLTQEELGEKTELSTRTIQRIEKGEVDPRAYSLQMIAKALDVDYRLFVEDEFRGDPERRTKDHLILGLIHLSGILLLLFPSFLIWHSYKDKVNSVTEHFREVIGFQLTMWLVFLLGLPQYLIVGMPYMFYFGIICTAFFSVVNTLLVVNGKPYKYFNFIKFNGKKKRV